ncbi:MAG: ABC transporter permease [Simkaniaceae bacterium]
MNKKNYLWAPFLGLFFRESRRFLRVYFQTIGTPLVSALLYLLIFGVNLGSNIHLEAHTSYLAFLIPGIMMLTALRNSFENATSSIIVGRYTNELQDYKVVPLSNEQILWAVSLASVFRGLLVALLTFFSGEMFYFFSEGRLLAIAHPIWLLYYILFSLLAFSFMGFYVSMKGNNFEQINGVGSFILLPLLYLGGIFFPVSSLHPMWQRISKFNPLLYIIEGTQYCFSGTSTIPLSFTSLWTIGFTILFYLLCQITLKKGFRYRW